ncbi:MAG TPA: amino acid racemase [Pyrinomonadaceae bacterium]|nr:amino acid racemase [Pyrinomonadaceae bacterium]
MKTVGIIGGVGPESTIEYYRLIIAAYRNQQMAPGVSPGTHGQDPGATSYPSIIINSVDLSKLLAWIRANELDAFTNYLSAEIERLARAGANFGALASNTPHLVFDELRRRSPIPLISIVESACDAAQKLGLERVGLFGTRFTMQARFYLDVFAKAGITIAVPREDEQAYIHEKYMQELLNNLFLPETRQRLLAIVERMKAEDNIEALILGGTELPLILRDTEYQGTPFLDTTKIHVERIVAELVS